MIQRPTEPIVWPNTTQYKRALLRPDLAFHDPELRAVELDRDAMGTPASVEGQSAVVFFGRIAEQRITVRCLKRPVAFGERRYASLREVLAEWPQSPFAAVDWQSNGVLVAGRRWPIVRMDHVQGTSMRQYITRSLSATDNSVSDQMVALSQRWCALAEELHKHRIAHSDLQQDNVRVLDDGTLRLIDLDAVWAPPLAQMPPKEVGHRHFQHPERLRTGHWDAAVDTFSALVIHLSLRAIAADPALWDDYHNDENLIFTDADFENPGRTEIWARLAASRDLEVRDLVALLEQFCRQTVRVDVDLGTILRHRTLPGGEVYVVSGEPLTRAWWPSTAETDDDNGSGTAPGPGDQSEGWTSTTERPTVVDEWPYADLTAAPKPVDVGAQSSAHAPTGSDPDQTRRRIIFALLALAFVLVLVLALSG